MPRFRAILPRSLLGLGAAALAVGLAMVAVRWHHTIGYGALGVGALLALAGAGMALRASPASASDRGGPHAAGKLGLGGKRTRAIIIAAIIVGATLGTFAYGEYKLSSQSVSQFGLSLSATSAEELTYPNGSIGVALQVSAIGGVPPYTFVAAWGDKTVQTSPTGNFTRVFGPSVPIDTALTITAASSNKIQGYLSLDLPSLAPAAGGQENTKTIQVTQSGGAAAGSNSTAQTSTRAIEVVQSGGAAGRPAAGSNSTGQTEAAISATFVPGSNAPRGNFELIVVVVGGTSGQPIAGAVVSLDGTTEQTTPANGTVVLSGMQTGNHVIAISYGSWSASVPYIALGAQAATLYENVPGK